MFLCRKSPILSCKYIYTFKCSVSFIKSCISYYDEFQPPLLQWCLHKLQTFVFTRGKFKSYSLGLLIVNLWNTFIFTIRAIPYLLSKYMSLLNENTLQRSIKINYTKSTVIYQSNNKNEYLLISYNVPCKKLSTSHTLTQCHL